MKKILLVYVILLASKSIAQQNIQVGMLKKLDDTDLIDQMIARESRNLDSLIFFTPIWLSNQVASQYDESFGVIINKEMILLKIKENHLTNVSFIIRLIIAHEKMHAKQLAMMRLTGQNFQSLPIEIKKQMESQADLCAGFVAFFPRGIQLTSLVFDFLLTLFRNSQNTNQSIANKAEELSGTDLQFAKNVLSENEDAIRLFFKLGENEGQFGTHPDSYSREIAFEIGYDAFLLNFFTIITLAKSNTLTPLEWQFFNQLLAIFKNTLEIYPMDYFQGAFFNSWSPRSALKITHYLQEANKNILFKVNDTKWDTRSENPFFHFKLEVENDNIDSVFINMSILIKQVPRTDQENPLKSKILTYWTNIFKLGPGERKQFSDSTLWFGATDTTMPKVFFPGDRGSLYFSTMLNGTIEKKYFSPVSSVSSIVSGTASNDIKRLINHLPSIQRQFSSSTTNDLKSGAGLQWYDGEISYCTFIAGESFDLKVPIEDDSKPYLSKLIYSSNNIDTTTNKLKILVDEFKDIFSDYQINYHNERDSYPYIEITNDTDDILFTLGIEKEYRSYNIILEIDSD